MNYKVIDLQSLHKAALHSPVHDLLRRDEQLLTTATCLCMVNCNTCDTKHVVIEIQNGTFKHYNTDYSNGSDCQLCELPLLRSSAL